MYTASITVNKKKKTIKKEKILTIGIITKNEKIKLERCLKSLMPLKEALDCEIIVTDTGSTDGTVEMARGYADKVIDYKWNDNFSDARNTGIKAAKGLWFMWIDSDEWLDDVAEIAEFFNSGKYKQYASTTVIMRDYQNGVEKYQSDKNNGYMEINLKRLILLGDGIKFEGKIHERITGMPPLKYLSTILNHDGYQFQTKEENMLKRKRNIVPLLEEYNKNPKDLSTINYLIREYFMMKDYEKAIEYGYKSIDVAKYTMEHKDFKGDKTFMKSCILYAKLKIASAFYNTGRDVDVIDMLENEVDNQPKASFLFVDVYGLLFKAYVRMEDIKKTLTYAEKYIEKYNEYIHDKLDKEYTIGLFVSLNHVSVIIGNISFILNHYIASGDFDKTMEYFYILENLKLEGIDEIYTGYILEIADKFKRYELVNDMYIRAVNKEINISPEIFQHSINKSFLEMKKEDSFDFLRSLYNLNIQDVYMNLQKIKYLDLSDSEEEVKNLILKITQDEKFEMNSINISLLYFSLKYDTGVEKVSQKIDIQKISTYTKILIDNNEDIVDVVYAYYKEAIKKDIDMDTRHIIISLLESYTLVKSDIESLNIIFELYSVILPGFLEKMYNENILNEKYIKLLSPVLQFGYYIEKAGKLRLKEEIPLYIKELKKAVMAYPIMFKPVKAVINDMEEEMRKEQERDNEFSKLAKKIKEKIYQLIIEGNDKEALSIIAQLQSLIPHDEELKMLKNQMVLKGKMGFGKNKLLN